MFQLAGLFSTIISRLGLFDPPAARTWWPRGAGTGNSEVFDGTKSEAGIKPSGTVEPVQRIIQAIALNGISFVSAADRETTP